MPSFLIVHKELDGTHGLNILQLTEILYVQESLFNFHKISKVDALYTIGQEFLYEYKW